MKLNHLDLQTTDVQALATFFVTHFDLERRSNDRSPKIALLGDDAGFSLVIQHCDAPVYPPDFHLGFTHATPAPVLAHHARLQAAGLAVGAVDVNGRGTRFYVRAPGGILIEVSTPAVDK